MAEAAPPQDRPVRRPLRTRVERVERLTPGMVRVVVGGEDLEGFGAGPFTDHYVKLQFPHADPAARPRVRTYTVRAWDPARRLLTIDFVVHGDRGVAGPWAAAAKPGDELTLVGPGGAYTPDPEADWHLMVGDAAVLPAIGASLPRVPAGVPVHVIVALDDPADRQPLETPGDLRLTWVRRDGDSGGGDDDPLLRAVQALDFPAGRVHAFVHGEAGAVRAVRRHLLVDRGVPREALSVSGYWKRSRTEEGWREDKPEWKRLVEQDVAGAGG
jgi:NADPH-dependent ferric siderophore reductase